MTDPDGSADGPVREEWSAGGVVLRPDDDGPRVLLIRDPYGRWGLPKGHIEGEEEAHAAALREVREETGLDELILGPEVGVIDWRFHRRGVTVHKHCRFFLMGSPHGNVVPQVEEGITECRWLPLAEAIDGIGYENAGEILKKARRLVGETEQGARPWLAGGEASGGEPGGSREPR